MVGICTKENIQDISTAGRSRAGEWRVPSLATVARPPGVLESEGPSKRAVGTGRRWDWTCWHRASFAHRSRCFLHVVRAGGRKSRRDAARLEGTHVSDYTEEIT